MATTESGDVGLLNGIKSLIGAFRRKKYHLVMASVALSHLTACNAVGGKQQDEEVQPTSLQITSTDGTKKSPAVLNPMENDGAFIITWQDNKTLPALADGYDIDLYLSKDQTTDSVDLQIYHTSNVGLTLTPPGAGPDHSVNCTYASDNSIECKKDSEDIFGQNTHTDIQAFLNALPKSAYILVRICDRKNSRCITTSAPVTLE